MKKVCFERVKNVEKITSVSNDKIKDAVKLTSSSSYRRKTGRFILEGVRLCRDAVLTGVKVENLFFTGKAYGLYCGMIDEIIKKAENSFEISKEAADKISDTVNSQDVFCVCRMNETEKSLSEIKKDGKYIVLENIQNPDNLGGIIRTAEALGMDGAVLFSGCDIYNPKSQRASMGSLFRLPVFRIENIEELFNSAKEKNMKTIAAVVDRDAKKVTEEKFNQGTFCIVGNEGNGVSRETVSRCDVKLTVPMKGRAESLNASTAACILMWEMMK